jgi:glycosyltransferase involved in cell wall biosynthesis
LLLVGSGFEEAKLRALVARLAIEKRVTFMGRVANKDMPALYAKADVYVAMPQEEAFGHVFIEAIASGMPVLSTNTVGAREIIGNKLFGRIVPQGNIKRMAHWMEYFLDHPEAVRASSMLARAEFEKKYDWEQVIIPRYVSVYERLISEKQALRAEPEPWRA